MSPDKFCPEHGPYDASLGQCPYCANTARPAAPQPLGQDDMVTDLGRGRAQPHFSADEDAPTQIPNRPQGGRRNLDDEDPTMIGKRARMDDVTELAEVENGPHEMLGMLWVKEGIRRGKVYRIANGTKIGRKESETVDLAIDDPKISNPHAKFSVRENKFYLVDFDSKNGTFVNGQKIEAVTPLNENDIIKIGSTVFVLKTLD
jgi:hypothetical protein